MTATVTLDISAAKDDRTHEVVLDVTEVGRLGEGRVDIAATQTDAAGNVHEGVAQTVQFTIDTVNPIIGITSSQTGLVAYDDANIVTYTPTFDEAVQSITAVTLMLPVRLLMRTAMLSTA